jgi:hypothetical protein
MEHDKKDRRTRRTRQLLRDALLSLLKEKRYTDISVQDIIERADIARSTFYVHYIDKDDLLVGKWCLFASKLGHQAAIRMHEEHTSEAIFPTRGWFQHIQAQNDILKLIAKDSAIELAMKTLHGILRADVQRKVGRHLQTNDSIPDSLVVEYMATALMSLIKWWIRHNMNYSPQQMDEIFQRLVMPGVLSIRGD